MTVICKQGLPRFTHGSGRSETLTHFYANYNMEQCNST